jgi:density-regulated protein
LGGHEPGRSSAFRAQTPLLSRPFLDLESASLTSTEVATNHLKHHGRDRSITSRPPTSEAGHLLRRLLPPTRSRYEFQQSIPPPPTSILTTSL